MTYLFIALALLLVGGAYLLWQAHRTRQAAGLPAGELVYSDTGAWAEVPAPLVSRRYGLVGKPDYLVNVKLGGGLKGRPVAVPVEVKSRRRPQSPHSGHILQLGAYCLLVEDLHKQRPPYGLLHYADATLKIPFDDALRARVIEATDAIRQARRAPDMARQHSSPQRCRSCGYRHACGDQALASDTAYRPAKSSGRSTSTANVADS